jgi:hypothetical protein
MIHIHPDCKNDDDRYPGHFLYSYYSLGMVLIELGLWMQLDHLAEGEAFEENPATAPHLWLREYVPQLGPSMGSTYEDIVAWCLGATNRYGPRGPFAMDAFEKHVVNRIRDFLP